MTRVRPEDGTVGGSVPHIAAMVVTTVSTAAGVKCPVLYTHYTTLVHYSLYTYTMVM